MIILTIIWFINNSSFFFFLFFPPKDKNILIFTLKQILLSLAYFRKLGEIRKNLVRIFLNAILNFNYFIRFIAWMICSENILSILFFSDYQTVRHKSPLETSLQFKDRFNNRWTLKNMQTKWQTWMTSFKA